MNFDLAGIAQTYFMLSDDFSKDTLCRIIKYRLSLIQEFLPQIKNFENRKKFYKNNAKDKLKGIGDGELYLQDIDGVKNYNYLDLMFASSDLKQYEYHSSQVDIDVKKAII